MSHCKLLHILTAVTCPEETLWKAVFNKCIIGIPPAYVKQDKDQLSATIKKFIILHNVDENKHTVQYCILESLKEVSRVSLLSAYVCLSFLQWKISLYSLPLEFYIFIVTDEQHIFFNFSASIFDGFLGCFVLGCMIQVDI